MTQKRRTFQEPSRKARFALPTDTTQIQLSHTTAKVPPTPFQTSLLSLHEVNLFPASTSTKTWNIFPSFQLSARPASKDGEIISLP